MMRWIATVSAGLAVLTPMLATAQSSPSNFTSGIRYDANRQVVGTISADPDGSLGGGLPFHGVRNTYDSGGRLIAVEEGTLAAWQSEGVEPKNWASFTVHTVTHKTYDNQGRQASEAIAKPPTSGGTIYQFTQYSYDAAGRLECTAVRMNSASFGSVATSACSLTAVGSHGPDRITRNVYDAAGQLVQVRKAVGTPLEQAYATYSYTDNGKQEYVIDAGGNRAKFVYDGFDRQSHWHFPAKGAVSGYNPATQETALTTAGAFSTTDYEQYGYDPNGNRTSLRKRDGLVIGYSYDTLNRMALKNLPGNEQDVYYAYDLRGLQTRARFGSIEGAGITNAYDGLGRLTSSTNTSDGVSRTLSYDYDANGNRTRVTHPDGTYFLYAYDGLDRVTSIKENGTTELVGITYDNQGRRDLMSYANGSAVDYGYDAASRLASLGENLAGTSNDLTLSFTQYNPASQLLKREVSNDLYVYRDDVNLNRGYAANGLNQYTTSGPRSLDYDLNGNLKLDQASSNPTAADTSNYSYDSENRLTSAWGKQTATLSYDPMGRLMQVSGGSTGATHFLHDGDALVGEYDASGALLRRYVHGPGIDEPLVWYEGAGIAASARRWLHANHQGSVIAISDASGYAMGTYQANTYDAWGIPAGLASGVTTNLGRFQYTGQAWISELGMYHYKARIYSPQLGRFLQTDPIGYKDQVNLYAYVGNDPVNASDPSGLDKMVCNVVDGVATDCTLTPDDSDSTTVTYNITDHYTDGFGNDQTSTRSITQTYEGSISQEGWLSKQFLGTGNAILSSIEGNLSSLTGSNVTLTLGATAALPSPRQSLMDRALDPRVRSVVNEIYRPGAKIGNGSSMDAYRADGSHAQKLLERRTQLQRLLKDPNLTARDRAVVKELLQDIQNSLSGR